MMPDPISPPGAAVIQLAKERGEGESDETS